MIAHFAEIVKVPYVFSSRSWFKKCRKLFWVWIIALDFNVSQTGELQGKGAGAGESTEQGDNAQKPDPVFINNSGGDDAKWNNYADPFGRLVGIAFLCLGHIFIIVQGGWFFNYCARPWAIVCWRWLWNISKRFPRKRSWRWPGRRSRREIPVSRHNV